MTSVPAGRRLGRMLQASDSAGVGADLPRRSLVFDAIVAVVFLGLGLVLLQVLARTADADDRVFVVLVSLPLVLRRRLPRTSLGLTVAVALVQQAMGVRIGFHDSAVLFALYIAVGCTDRRFGRTALALGVVVALAGALSGWWGYVDRQLGSPHWWLRPLTTLGALILVVAAWALGERLRSARLGSIALAARAGQLERERESQAQLAAAAERARIAREMHDVIAHGLSVMIVQADGAAYVVENSPGTAKQALEQIAATGRASLTEMRNLLGLLRSGGDNPTSTPQPDLADLGDLLDQARRAGATVTLRGEVPAGLPAMVSLTGYRIIQEGLTNARKHGGPRTAVEVREEADGLRIRVGDRGRAPQSSAEPPGHGLVGVRERVAAVGGTVRAEPDGPDGFILDAWLPLGRTDAGGGA